MLRRIVLPVACAVLSACASLAPGYSDVSLENLFNAERDFAADAYARGIRAAFLAHFAPDAIVFQPGPVKYADLVKGHPPPADPTAIRLEWGPQAGAVSRAGDMGFTTGPTRVSQRDNPHAPAGYGYYLSVWSRASGEWKVIVDAGVSQASPPPQEGLPNMRTPIHYRAEAPVTAMQRAADRDHLLAIERLPRTYGVAAGSALAYGDLVTPATRVLRDDKPMLTGRALADDLAKAPVRRMAWTPIDGAVAGSDDLAYTYGTSHDDTAGAADADGYYVHVWQREGGGPGDWKLVADVALPRSAR